MQRTSIEWTDRSANPFRVRHKVTGKTGHHCVHHGPGCLHCYAERWNKWVGTGLSFLKPSGDLVEPVLDERVLRALLRLKEPQRVFLWDMTDGFGDWWPEEWIDRTLAVAALTPHITYQVLTKRVERMEAYFTPGLDNRQHAIELAVLRLSEGRRRLRFDDWPLPNVWLGVSVEDRKHGLPRVDVLRRIPAAVRFLSVEPLLEDLGEIDLTGIGLVIVGGESGHGSRTCDLAWIRSVVRQCQAAGVPAFVKQLGAAASDPPSGLAGARLKVHPDAAGLISRRLTDPKGGDWSEWPDDLRVREFPTSMPSPAGEAARA
jgi:protein gp37